MDSKIRVVMRVRPLHSQEKEELKSSPSPWVMDKNEIKHVVNSKTIGQPYVFDRVFLPEETTACIYNEICKPIVDAAISGINGTIFAYGQTSSGKTYTMMGSKLNPGIIPQVVEGIFNAIENTPDREFLLRVSYMEIYNEIIVDLLQKEHVKNKSRQSLKIHQDAEGNTYVSSLTEYTVTSANVLVKCMEQGERRRTIAETSMNDASSRSHSIFRVVIESRSVESNQDGTDYAAVTVSQLNLVDLAGSERAGQMGEIGDRLKEGCAINKSLSALGQVISALSEGSDGQNGQFVNYRESKLTRILQPALGGNAMTVIICTITPASVQESHSTLRFATRAKKIMNKPKVNEVMSGEAEMQRYAKEIAMLQNKLQEFTVLQQKLQTGSHKMQEMEKALAEKNELNMQLERQVREMNAKFVVSSLRTQPSPLLKLKEIRRLTWCGERVHCPSLKRQRLQPLLSTAEELSPEGDSLSSKQQDKDTFEDDKSWCLDNDSNNLRNPFSTEKTDASTNTEPELSNSNADHQSCLLKIEELMTVNKDLKKDRDGCLKEYRELQEFTKLEKDVKVLESTPKSNQKVADISRQNEYLSKSVTDMETLLRDGNKSLSELKQENSELQCNLKIVQDELNACKGKMSMAFAASNHNDELQKEVAELKKCLSHFETIQSDCDFKLEQQSLKFKSREADLCDQLKDAYEKMNKYDSGGCKPDTQSKAFFSSDNCLKSITDQLSAAEEKIRSLEMQLLNRQQVYDTKVQDLVSKCTSLTESLQFNVEFIPNENQPTSNIADKFPASKSHLDEDLKLLTTDLTELCKDNPELTDNLQALQSNFRRRSLEMGNKPEISNRIPVEQPRDEKLQSESKFKGPKIDFVTNMDTAEEPDQLLTDVKLWSLEMGMLASATEKELLEEVMSLRAKCARLEGKSQDFHQRDLELQTLQKSDPEQEECPRCSHFEAEISCLRDAEQSLKLKLDELILLRQESDDMLKELNALRPLPSHVESLQSKLESVRNVYEEQFHEATRRDAIIQNLQIDKDLLHSEKEAISTTLQDTLQEMTSIKEDLSMLNAHVLKITSENQSLTESMQSKQEEMHRKVEEISFLTEKCGQLEKRLNEATSEGQLVALESLREQFGDFLNMKLSEQEAQLLKEKSAAMAELERTLYAKMDEAMRLSVHEERMKVTEEMNCLHQEKMTACREKEEQMEDVASQLKITLNNLKLDLQEKDNQIESLKQELSSVKCQVCTAFPTLEEDRRSFETKCQEIVELNGDLAVKLVEISKLKENLLQCEMQISAAEEKFCLAQRCAEENLLDHQNKSEFALLSLTEKNDVEMKSIMEKHSMERCNMLENISGLEKKVAELENSLDSMTHVYENEKNSLQLEIESLKSSQNLAISHLEAANQDLQEKLIAVKQSLEDEKIDFDIQMKQLVESHMSEVLQLKQETVDLEKSYRKDITAYIDEIGELKLQLQKKEKCSSCRQLSQECDSLFRECSTLEQQLMELRDKQFDKDKLFEAECKKVKMLNDEIAQLKAESSKQRNGENVSQDGCSKDEIEKLKTQNVQLQEKLDEISTELDRVGKFCDNQTKEFEDYTMVTVEVRDRMAAYEKIINAVKEANEVQRKQRPTAALKGTDVPFSKEAIEKLIFPMQHYENLIDFSKIECKNLTMEVNRLTQSCEDKKKKISELQDELEKSKAQGSSSDSLLVSQLKQRITQLLREQDRNQGYKNELRRLQAQLAEPTVSVGLKNTGEEPSPFDCLNYGSGTVNSFVVLELKEERIRMEKKMHQLEAIVEKQAKHIHQLKHKLREYKTRLESVMHIVDHPTASNVKSLQLDTSCSIPLSVKSSFATDNIIQHSATVLSTPTNKMYPLPDSSENHKAIEIENSPPKRSRFENEDFRACKEETTKITLSPESREQYEKCKVQ